MALEAGTLGVTLQYAQGIKDMDWFGRQDPYCRLRIGSQERRSRVCRDGGRNPVWDDTFEFTIVNENTLDLTLMDEDRGMSDDLIGTATISLAKAREHGRDVVQAPVSSGKKTFKSKGFVQVSLSFVPNSKLRPQPQPAYQQPTAPPAYGYPAAPPAPMPAYGYGYPPAPAPSYGPSPGYYPAPSFQYSASFQYSPSFQHPQAQTQAPGWPAAPPPAYGAPPPPSAPSYYPPPPASAPAPGYGGGYYGAAPYRG